MREAVPPEEATRILTRPGCSQQGWGCPVTLSLPGEFLPLPSPTSPVLRKDGANATRKPVEAQVSVNARNLNGQQKNMEIRRVNEGDAIYYIGEISISGPEILVFDIAATPSTESTPITAQLRREFFSD